MPAVRSVLVAAALVVSLAGCAGSSGVSGPVVKPPLQSRAPSPSPSPVASTKPPAAAQANTRDGASAFATFYIGLLSDAYQTLDTTDLKRYTNARCVNCGSIIAGIEMTSGEGKTIDGGRLDVLVSVAPPLDGDGTVIVDLRYQRQPGKIFDKTGNVVADINEPAPVDLRIRVGRATTAWQVLGLQTAETGSVP